jgi:hypothetical protein
MMKNVAIYCDGGFGNRFNSLVSGLAIASFLGWRPTVYWPQNNWCRAPFGDIFSSDLDVSGDSLTKLAGGVGNRLPMLHDDLAVDLLQCKFSSAYKYDSLESLRQTAEGYEGIFYYPALIPKFIPQSLINGVIMDLEFTPFIKKEAKSFLEHNFKTPFYGIHLRRTDLHLGYSNAEVEQLVNSKPDILFFACSDDPITEKIVAAYPNVRVRSKQSYAGKKVEGASWNALTLDDDSRPYYSNIERDADSVIEAVVDLLILGHSTIVGYTGSTFQAVSRLVCDIRPLVGVNRPPQIDFICVSDEIRKISGKQYTVAELLDVVKKLEATGRLGDAKDVLRKSLDGFTGEDLASILVNLSICVFNSGGSLLEATMYLDSALDLSTDSLVLYELKAKMAEQRSRKELALKALACGYFEASRNLNHDRRAQFGDLIVSLLSQQISDK